MKCSLHDRVHYSLAFLLFVGLGLVFFSYCQANAEDARAFLFTKLGDGTLKVRNIRIHLRYVTSAVSLSPLLHTFVHSRPFLNTW
ncbi:hypothetical protein EDD18DRAFT_343176 [Armillaria luteobubalina]|uniref:Uncharacterized protein n=1 Tax=Armillaria luteobubalina TaxID=153913 RepID=A0AA39Q3A5_9AGAR|nr:hypothetical protein EDD18DRAFT_343176 [Armillaria luteobubalina]